MSWLRNSSFRTSSIRQQSRPFLRSDTHCDPTACFDSFKEHWHQTYKIIQRSQHLPSHDDVLGVVNHLEQMVTLLLYDISLQESASQSYHESCSCLEYLLSENILNKLYDWGLRTGRYSNAVRLEQLKLYEMLISQSRHQLLVHEPFLRPLLKLLMSCQDEIFPSDVEKRLVILLNQLCVLLMQNIDLLDLFFYSSNQDRNTSRFIIFSLLIPFIHREGAIGMQARDALLLCMSLSKKNKNIGAYIANHSNICILLASGLNGLYSNLPHTLNDIEAEDWHRFTPDDVNDIKGLASFMNSLEFCNAVAQVAHPMIKQQLHEFLYSGFLIPVIGPSLLQNSTEEQIAATAYLELLLRSATEPGILLTLVKFLMEIIYDGKRIIDILISRLKGNSKLILVCLALFETMVNLNCEDIMLELVFQHLQPCMHLMLTQRPLLHDFDPYCRNVDKFLLLIPACCCYEQSNESNVDHSKLPDTVNCWQLKDSLYGNYHAYLCDARNKIAACKVACSSWVNRYDGCDGHRASAPCDDLSLSGSSGYESFKCRLDLGPELADVPIWQSSISDSPSMHCALRHNSLVPIQDTSPSSSVGLFLDTLFDLLQTMLNNNVYVNIHLTGLFSRLAIYSQPLLRTYLLNQKLVLQPNVRSLFQVIGTLKKKLDEYMHENTGAGKELKQARWFLIERETRLFNMRKRAKEGSNVFGESSNVVESSGTIGDPFKRDENKRRSLSSSFSSMFRRVSHSERSIELHQEDPPNSHHSHISNLPLNWYIDADKNQLKTYALCSIVLEEWLKELAAISQEHTISQLTNILN